MRRFTIAFIVVVSPVLAAPVAARGQDGWQWTTPRPEASAAKRESAANHESVAKPAPAGKPESVAKPAAPHQPTAAVAPAPHAEPAKRPAVATTRRRPAHGRAAGQHAGVATRSGWVSLAWPEPRHEVPWQRLAWPDWTAAEVRPDTGSPDR